MGAYLFLVAFLVPMIRNIMLYYVVMVLIGMGIWIGSIHVDYPNRLALIWIALFVDVCGQSFYIFIINGVQRMGPKARAWVDKTFEYYPAMNIEHRTERMNAFVTLVFGYAVVAMIYQSTVNGIDAHFGKAILGLTSAFCFNWMYFEVDGSNLHVHAIRRHKGSALCWMMIHLPFIMAFVLGSGALARLVLVTDTPNSKLDFLTEDYRRKAEPDIAPGIRWFFCAGWGVAMMCMGVISVTHVHKEID